LHSQFIKSFKSSKLRVDSTVTILERELTIQLFLVRNGLFQPVSIFWQCTKFDTSVESIGIDTPNEFLLFLDIEYPLFQNLADKSSDKLLS